MWILILLPIIVISIIGITYVSEYKADIQSNWVQYRCHPAVIPLAHLFKDGNGKKIDTFNNAYFCFNSLGAEVLKFATEPFAYIFKLITDILGDTVGSIDSIRGVLNRIQVASQDFMAGAMNRTASSMSAIVIVMTRMRDVISRLVGTGVIQASIIQTVFSLIEACFDFLIGIIKATLAVVFAISILLVFIFPEALAIAIPLGAMLGMSYCFHPGTEIELLGGQKVLIKDIEIGHILKGGHKVTGKMKFYQSNDDMYDISGVIVSGNHKVLDADRRSKTHRISPFNASQNRLRGYSTDTKISGSNGSSIWFQLPEDQTSPKSNTIRTPYKTQRKIKSASGKWLCAENHSLAQRVKYIGPVYSLITDTNRILINGVLFADFEEVSSYEDLRIIEKIVWGHEIFEPYSPAFSGDIYITLKDRRLVKIKHLQIGDEIVDGSIIQGIVQLDGSQIPLFGEGISGSTWVLNRRGKWTWYSHPTQIKSQSLVYHLITNTGVFRIGDIIFRDYLDTHNSKKLEEIDYYCLSILNDKKSCGCVCQ